MNSRKRKVLLHILNKNNTFAFYMIASFFWGTIFYPFSSWPNNFFRTIERSF